MSQYVFEVGQVALVRYKVAGPAVWHERLVVGLVSGVDHTYCVVTPDGDEYDEELVGTNVDLQGIFCSDGLGCRVERVSRSTYIHGFDLPSLDQLKGWIRNAAVRLGQNLPDHCWCCGHAWRPASDFLVGA